VIQRKLIIIHVFFKAPVNLLKLVRTVNHTDMVDIAIYIYIIYKYSCIESIIIYNIMYLCQYVYTGHQHLRCFN